MIGVSAPASFQPSGSKRPTNSTEQTRNSGPIKTPITPSHPGTALEPISATPAKIDQTPGQRVAEVLAHGHAEVAVEGLEDDVDRLARGESGWLIGGNPGQVRDQERPADQAEELDHRGEHADDRAEDHDGAIGVGDRDREQHRERREQHRGERERPPDQDQRGTARPEALEHLVGRPAQDVRVVEALGEQSEADVEEIGTAIRTMPVTVSLISPRPARCGYRSRPASQPARAPRTSPASGRGAGR